MSCEWPPAANLTPAGNLEDWSEDDFFTAFRTGVKLNGQRFNEAMPVVAGGQMTDDELKALWLFMQTIPLEFAQVHL